MVLEFKDHTLNCPQEVVHHSSSPRTRNSFVFPKDMACIYVLDTEFHEYVSLFALAARMLKVKCIPLVSAWTAGHSFYAVASLNSI